ncbi:MAG: bifunctional DNA-formamidopyrimidine glycosylase/DNA-(apurinic or apyrimidinic site) lyase [Gemmatimonadota bacterium]|nr:MAG: bifunctional DNA-formamidopyrimidine glycosylase/DNA-(apurinic or apyrimidinic site) lyase [Gemmatimonadota bacterium]
MPELPEVETIARGLDAAVGGSRFRRIKVHREEAVRPAEPADFRAALRGRCVERVSRRAKWLVAQLDDGGRWLTQLRMTGRFTWGPVSPLRSAPHLSVSFLMDSPTGVLRFYDVRRFGRMWVVDPEAWSGLDERLGIEPLSEGFTPDTLAAQLARSKAPIRNLLLDQRRLAGVGNIYANEACYRARLDPRRPAGSLKPQEVRALHAAIRKVLSAAITRRGTTFSDYRDILGGQGGFQNKLEVYGRDGQSCRRCRGTVERTVMAGRSAFFCADCQS